MHFERIGVKDLVIKSSKNSLSLAIVKAETGRSFLSILQRWFTQQEKVYALIRAAIQNSVGLNLYREREAEATVKQKPISARLIIVNALPLGNRQSVQELL